METNMKKLIAFTLLFALMATAFVFSAAAESTVDYGYYDRSQDGRVELVDVLLQIDAMLNDKSAGVSLSRILRTFKIINSSTAVSGTVTEVDDTDGFVYFTVDGIDGFFSLPCYTFGLEGVSDAICGRDVILCVPSPAEKFFAEYDPSFIYAAEIGEMPEAEPVDTVTTTVHSYFTNKETGELFLYIDLLENEIPASELGITQKTKKIDYLGLPLTLSIDCEASDFKALYSEGEAHILSCELPKYKKVDNLYYGTVATERFYDTEKGTDEYYIMLDTEEFSTAEYNVFVRELTESGWMHSDIIRILDGLSRDGDGYFDEDIAKCSVYYRTFEEQGKKNLELLYLPLELGGYIERELINGETDEVCDYVLISRYMGAPVENLDGELSYFEESFIGGAMVSNDYIAPMGESEASLTVKTVGEAVRDGDFIYYNYNSLDNEIIAVKNIGELKTGVLSGTNHTNKTVVIDGATYGYSRDAFEEYDHYRIVEALEATTDGYDNIQYLTLEGELLFCAQYTSPELEKSYDYAIISFNDELLAELLGITLEEYHNKLVGRYFIEDDFVVAAFLDKTTGKWEKGYVKSVALDYDSSLNDFTTFCDIAKLAYYNEIATLSSQYQMIYDMGKSVLEHGIVLVYSEDDGVYTVGDYMTIDDARQLVKYGYNDDGIVFDGDGITNRLSDGKGLPKCVATGDNTVTVLIDSGSGVGVRLGKQTPAASVYDFVEVFDASEELIVFRSYSISANEWVGIASEEAETVYYTVTCDSEFEISLSDDGTYEIVLTNLFNHTTNTLFDYVYTTDDSDKAWEVYDVAAFAPAGEIVCTDEMGILSYADCDYSIVLTEKHEDGHYSLPYELVVNEDGSLSLSTEIELYYEPADGFVYGINCVDVVTLDLVGYDKENYDFSQYLAGDRVTRITKATAGVLDATVISAAQTAANAITVPAKDGVSEAASITVEIYAIATLKEDGRSVDMELIKIVSGGNGDDGPVVEFPRVEDAIEIPEVGIMVLSTDARVLSELLGISEAEYESELVSGYYIEDNKIVVASLDTASGEWEKAYVTTVMRDFDPYDGFFNGVDLVTVAKYREIATLSPFYEAAFIDASSVLANGIAIIASEDNGVYTLANIGVGYELDVGGSEDEAATLEWHYLVDCYEDHECKGLTFDSEGRTNAIKATSDESVAAAPVTLTEDTLIIAVSEDGVFVRRGVLEPKDSIGYGFSTFYSASEELILLFTNGDLSGFASGDMTEAAYYAVLGDSYYEIETVDDGGYTLTAFGLLNIATGEEEEITLEGETLSELVWMRNAVECSAGSMIYKDKGGKLSLADVGYEGALLELYGGAVFPISAVTFENLYAEVVTVDATYYDKETYDYTALQSSAPADLPAYEGVPVIGGYYQYRMDLAPLQYAEGETAGLLDKFTVDLANTTVVAAKDGDYENGAYINVEFFAVMLPTEEAGMLDLRIVRLLSGGKSDEAPILPEYPETKKLDYAVFTTDEEVMIELLDLDYDTYVRKLTDRFYVEEGKVVAAFLNKTTGEWEKGYIGAVAYGYSKETASFDGSFSLAELAEYAALVPLTGEKQDRYMQAQMMCDMHIAAVVESAGGVYTLADINTAAASDDATATDVEFLVDRWVSGTVNGLTFDGGVTNAIADTRDGEAKPVALTDSTVIALVTPMGVEVRHGIQTEEQNLTDIDLTVYSASSELILAFTYSDVSGWGKTEGETDRYLMIADSTVSVERLDGGDYLVKFERVVDLATLEILPSVTHKCSGLDVTDILYMAEVEGTKVLCITPDSVWVDVDTVRTAFAESAEGYSEASVDAFASETSMEISIYADEYVEITEDTELSGITVNVMTAYVTEIPSFYDKSAAYIDLVYEEGRHNGANAVTDTGRDMTFVGYPLSAEGKVTVSKPTAGVFSQIEIDGDGLMLYAPTRKGTYECIGRLRCYYVAAYDAENNEVTLNVLKLIEQ